MVKYNLFLDDFRSVQDAHNYLPLPEYGTEEWVIVRDYREFVKYIEENGLPFRVSFDHDLADVHYDVQDYNIDQDYYDMCEEKTGYHCALWMINYCLDNELDLPEHIIIHSMNGVGARNIQSLFTTYRKVHGK
jgi:hypothetical protein